MTSNESFVDENNTNEEKTNDYLNLYILKANEAYDHIYGAFPITLVYGEITFGAFATVFQKIKDIYGKPGQGTSGDGTLQSRGGKFYDLGSGTGKPVIAAALLHNFDLCCGIEILEGLYSVSLEAIDAYNTRGKIHPLLVGRDIHTQCKVIRGDFLDIQAVDWRDGDVVFANSTCYDELRLEQIAEIARGMKKGSFFISLTRRLPIGDFEVVECDVYPMSWGDASIFIMQKTTDPTSGPMVV